MHERISPKLIISILFLVFILFILSIFFLTQRHTIVPIRPVISTVVHNNQNSLSATEIDRQTFPERLRIPSINVDALVEQVSITTDGAMEVPRNPLDVGWYNLGPKPGEKGSAVIAGHVDGTLGQPEVFANLYKLKSGDKLSVIDAKGTVTTFVVRESRTFDPGFAAEVFNSQEGTHLNLITCDGTWDGIKKSYSKRLVVFTDIMTE